MRIDAHHHLWKYSAEEYGWIGDDQNSLRRDFLLEELYEAVDSAQVDVTIGVQARQTTAETEWLLDLADRSSVIRGVIGWLPIAEPGFERVLQSFLRSTKLKGLRHVVQGEAPGFLDRDDFNKGIRALLCTDLVYDVLIYSRQLAEATRFVDRHPKQSFVLDHIGKPDIRSGEFSGWSAAIRELARRPNITCKLSGMVTEADWTAWDPNQLLPYTDVVLDAFGPQRTMIGTDWPVLTVGCSYAQWWQTVERWIAALSQEEQRAILGETAARVYYLESSQQNAGTNRMQDTNV